MYFYFLFIRIAALFGHRKARAMVKGQKETSKFQLSTVQPIWIHAASVGEFEQARPLIERLRREQPQRKIVVTFFSPSGYEARKNYKDADAVLYLPFATRRNARRFIAMLRPAMAVFVKYEFWPAYLRELKKQNIPTYSLSSIFRPNQYFFRWWGMGQRRVLKCFTRLYVQDEASRQLLAKYGITQVSVVGDTRFDRVKEVLEATNSRPSDRLTPIAHFVEGCERVLIAGSTWPEDDRLLARYMEKEEASTYQAPAKLIIVPHELDERHMHFLFNLFRGKIVKYTDIENCSSAENARNILVHARVLVVDTMGLLSSIYRFGQVAYIGGGFGEGIHNTIEAAVYGMPVLFGPKYHHFREAQGLIDAGAAMSVKNYRQLEAGVDNAFANHVEMGAKAAEYVSSELGATGKIYADLFARP